MTTNYWDSYFGLEKPIGPVGNSVFTVTDGDLSVDFMASPGFKLLSDGWTGRSSTFKGGGSYGNSAIADGQVLRYAVFDNVIESFRFVLEFSNTDDMIRRIDQLEELLLYRAPRYWLNRFNNSPVYITRKLDGETNTGYALISQGNIIKPNTWFDEAPLRNQKLLPFVVQINRQPAWLGAVPGTVQKSVAISAQQVWDFATSWGVETTLPTGYIFCFVELANGDIYAGGASEILFYDLSLDTWAVKTTAPVIVSGNVTGATLLANGDILFGENGRILKLTSGGTWSVETTGPAGQVYELLEATSGEIYAADTSQIYKKDETNTWGIDDTLPSGQVYSLLQVASGRIYAGGTGEILRTASPLTTTEFSVQIATSTDDAEETSGTMDLTSNDLDMFNKTSRKIGLRFQGVTIAQGSTIDSAKIRFIAEDTDSGTSGTALIYCEDIDDAPTFTSTANNITDRTKTPAVATWSGVETWKSGLSYDTVDISAPIQEVINRAGFASGNDIVIIIEFSVSGRDRDADTYDKSPGNAATLIIEYAAPLGVGATWEVNSTFPAGNVRALAEVSSVIFGGDDGQIISSEDSGTSWEVADTTPTNDVRSLRYCSGVFYAGDNGNILKSSDQGNNWTVDSTLPGGYVEDILCTSANKYVADNGQILSLTTTSFNVGQEASSTNPVFVANKHNEAQLTHIKNDDGGVFANLYPGSFPLTLFPATAALNDAVYFGINTALSDTGPFNSLVFDLSTGASSTTSYTIIWEYYNGAWTTITTQDSTSQFSLVGMNSVTWEIPSDWTTTAINAITAYWVRARVSALTGTFTNPIQQTRDIYTAVTPYAEIAAAQTAGTLDSIVQMKLRSRGDNGGPGGSNPQLYANRVLAGIMPVTNHTTFRAYLNFADEQQPDGVTVSVTDDTDSATSIADNLSAPTGRAAFFDASVASAGAGLNNLIDRVKLTLATTVARDYYGTFRAFLRGKQTGGSAGEVSVRLKIVSGSGGISSLTDIQATTSTTDHELIEFEEPVSLPVSSLFTSDELGDETSIVLQITSSAADADFYAYDLFLLPTNLMYVDVKDTANTTTSAISNGSRMTIDSVTLPKLLIKAVAEKTATGLFKSSYRVDSNGAAALMTQQQQRIWILTASTSTAGGSIWISKPEALHSITVGATDRWLTGRGAN